MQDGFFYAYEGDVEQSQSLIHHPLVDQIHMTGGTNTHDAIVWGDTPETQRRNKSNNTLFSFKPISSELGNVTPWLIIPEADWTPKRSTTWPDIWSPRSQHRILQLPVPEVVILDSEYRSDISSSMPFERDCAKPPHSAALPRYGDALSRFYRRLSRIAVERIQTPAHPGMADHGMGAALPWLLFTWTKTVPTMLFK